jgi:hypothetical protein
MGVDTRISLPGNVRVRDVANVIAILLGAKVTLEPLQGSDATAARLEGVAVKIRQYDNMPEMVRIEVPHQKSAFNYHFEHGGRRMVSGRSTAETIAVGRGLIQFFGGAVDINDCDDEIEDYTEADNEDEINCPEDGALWQRLQNRIAALKPLGAWDLAECVSLSAYKV